MAITILTHFHAMSGFVFGCGINENFMHELNLKQQADEAERKRRLAEETAARLVANDKPKVVKYSHMHSHGTDTDNSDEEPGYFGDDDDTGTAADNQFEQEDDDEYEGRHFSLNRGRNNLRFTSSHDRLRLFGQKKKFFCQSINLNDCFSRRPAARLASTHC